MIDTNLQKAVALEFLRDSRGLIDALFHPGERAFIDAPLIGFQTRHMGIAVAGDTVRRQHCDDCAGLAQRNDGLQRQAADQVEIQTANTGSPQPRHSRFDIPHRLPPPDRRLNQRIDVLHAKARAVDRFLHSASNDVTSRSRLDRVFETGIEKCRRRTYHGCKPSAPRMLGVPRPSAAERTGRPGVTR